MSNTTKFLSNERAIDLWTKLKQTLVTVDDSNSIKEMVKTALQEVEGVHSQFTFPFSNESLTENKITFSTEIRLKEDQ